MKAVAGELESIIKEYVPRLSQISEGDYAIREKPGKWSRKEILGHLVDSAQNNIRRFLVAQYETRPKIIYDQDQWVRLNNYQNQNADTILSLWRGLNQQAVNILNNMAAGNENRECEAQTINSIEWFARDYIKHLKHHLHQILNMEPIAYP